MKNKIKGPGKISGVNQKRRKIDMTAAETYSWWHDSFALIHKKKIKTWKAIFIVAFFAGAAAATVWITSLNLQRSTFAAGQAKMIIDPVSQTVDLGEEFDIDIVLDTSDTDVVVAKAVVMYNPINFELLSWDTSQSSFAAGNTCVYGGKPCEIINNDPSHGKITITVAKPSPGVNSNSATIGSIRFKSLAPINPTADNINLSFSRVGAYTDSDVIEDSGNGNDILDSVQNARVYVVPPVCTEFTYSGWGSCQPNGTQTRTITGSLPDGCSGGTPAPLTQSCTPPAGATCTSFTYSAWSACQPDGKRTRTVTSSVPQGCQGGNPILVENCDIITPTCTGFEYTDWGSCQVNGVQVRTVNKAIPSGCNGGVEPVLSQSCTRPDNGNGGTCTSFLYTDWSACQPNGIKVRSITSSLPLNCTGGEPLLESKCDYASNNPAKKDDDSKNDEKENHPKPKFTDLPKFLTKRPGDKVWWKVAKPWRVDHYQVEFNGKRIDVKKDSFNIPANTPKGTHKLKVKAINKSGATRTATTWIRVR